MTDLSLRFDPLLGSADLLLAAGDLETDDGLRTAIAISLFTDARAADDDDLPQSGGERRGWWGDFDQPAGEQTGSRLWLLERSKATREDIARARDYADAALAWLVADGVASLVTIEVEAQARDRLAIGVTVDRPAGPGRQRYDYVWDAMNGTGYFTGSGAS